MYFKYDQATHHPLDALTFDEFAGAILSERRAETGMSREYLAESLEITSQELKDIEAGMCRPSAALFVEMAKRFGLSPSDLLAEYTDLFDVRSSVQVYGNVIFFARA